MVSTNCVRKCYTKLVFLHPVGFVGDTVHSIVSRVRNIDALFFMLGWGWYRFYKKHVITRYGELVFFHPVGSIGHVVHSGAIGMRNINALFFILGWE
jgi:hypothetical protein